MPMFEHDGLRFHYRDEYPATGGDVGQTFGLYSPPPSGVRLIAFDARAHGETQPLGDPKKISLASYADDLVALLDHLRIDRAVVGGISMGAALALNAALRYPDR